MKSTQIFEYPISVSKMLSTNPTSTTSLIFNTSARYSSPNSGNVYRHNRGKYYNESTKGKELEFLKGNVKNLTILGSQNIDKCERLSVKSMTIHPAEKSENQHLNFCRNVCSNVSADTSLTKESGTTEISCDSNHDEDLRFKNIMLDGKWHGFQRGVLMTESVDSIYSRTMDSMTCGQLLVLRKLALLKLTACMERFCPTHKSGWNWEFPKFIRKIKTPEYKDDTIFGVPLLLSLQRTGTSLPRCIENALSWLRTSAIDQVGLFRRSGVRSRIQQLKNMMEPQNKNVNFDGQNVFDVADLIKQYFRELPEALLTNKLSGTFIAIFQRKFLSFRTFF